MPEEIILEMKDIEIQFPGVKALDKVNFTLRKGEVHSLLGENGAKLHEYANGEDTAPVALSYER